MKTLSIFNGGYATYPAIFKTTRSKECFDETLLTIKSFTLGTDRKFPAASINSLKNNLGIIVEGVPTFKTPFIAGNTNVLYNGYNFVLNVSNDIVSLVVIDGKQSIKIDCWDLNLLTKTLDCKNLKCDFITKSYVSDLIVKGRLKVKFMVGVDKNHGTQWKLV